MNSTTTNCGCGGTSSMTASAIGCGQGGPGMERVRFFARQLLTPDDLTQEQEYLRAKLRRHNRLLHGWGVVCGCEVTPAPAPWTVTIDPGYVLGPQGDEILIDTQLSIDISKRDPDGNAILPCADPTDPWCAGVRVTPRANQTLFIAVAYADCPTRPVRVQPAGCGCDGGQCEYSRIRDSYVVRVLDQLPASYADINNPPKDPFACPDTGVRQCPTCVADPWVILATVTAAGPNLSQQAIDNRSYRRYVAALGSWWFKSPPESGPPPSPARVTSVVPADGSEFRLIEGQGTPANFPSAVVVQFDKDLTAATVNGNSVQVTVSREGAPAQPLAGRVDYDGPNRRATFTPSQPFQGGVSNQGFRYTVSVTGDGANAIQDVDGLPLDGDVDGNAGGTFTSRFSVFFIIG
jgi:hypothetical protein